MANAPMLVGSSSIVLRSAFSARVEVLQIEIQMRGQKPDVLVVRRLTKARFHTLDGAGTVVRRELNADSPASASGESGPSVRALVNAAFAAVLSLRASKRAPSCTWIGADSGRLVWSHLISRSAPARSPAAISDRASVRRAPTWFGLIATAPRARVPRRCQTHPDA